MDESASLRKLPLLPKLDPVERTLSHVRAQSAYLTFYASEGRAYTSSWRDDSESNIAKNAVEKETVMIDLGTPVLKPRVKQVSKSIISVCSTKSGVKDTAIVHRATTRTSKKRNDELAIGEKHEVKANRSKRTRKKTQPKKKRVPSLSDNSSAVERLKERREKKRAKRAIVSPPSSSDKENVEEKRSTRKKMPVGFALMHGFTATNVGKNRLTVKPSVSIGVFNKGKASVKTKATKAKASGTKGHAGAYFSESMFLNKTRAVLDEDESSCISMCTPSSGVAVKKSSKKKSKKKADDESPKISDIKSTAFPSSSPKKPSVASIVWDIELGKPLCSIDPPMSTAPAEKLGSVVLDVTRHTWAKLLDKCDPNQKKTSIVAMSRPGTGSKGESEALASIGPSQSASQIVTKITSPAKRDLQEAHRSKYFPAEPTKSQYEIRVESTPPPSVPDDVNHLLALEYEQPVQETNAAANLHFPTEIPEIALGLQQESRCNCQVATEVVVSPFDILDQEQDCALGADVDDPIWTGHEEINYFDDPFGEHVNLEDGEIPVLEQDYFMNDATGWELGSESGHNFQDFDFADNLTQDHDCFAGNAIHEDTEMDQCYNHVSIEGYEDPRYSEDEQAIGFNQDEDCETSGQCLSEINEKEDTEQVHRFSQGRALLSGCSMQEIGHSNKTHTQYPRLFLLEADVAKSLRDHWHPQRL